MRITSKRLSVSVAAVGSALLLSASLAWACVPTIFEVTVVAHPLNNTQQVAFEAHGMTAHFSVVTNPVKFIHVASGGCGAAGVEVGDGSAQDNGRGGTVFGGGLLPVPNLGTGVIWVKGYDPVFEAISNPPTVYEFPYPEWCSSALII